MGAVDSSVNLDDIGNLTYFMSSTLATARHPQTLLATHSTVSRSRWIMAHHCV